MDKRSKVAILGFGVEGRATFDYLEKHEYHDITICDQNVDLKAELPQGASARLGNNYLEKLTDFDVIFRSPGIKYLAPEIQYAIEKGVEVTSTTNFFVDQCPCPIIGVTGTKGKGTTSTLIFEMLKKSGKNSGVDLFLGGNIGQCPMEFLEQLTSDSIVILELSSFQLQDLKKSPHYAVILNTTNDHLDYHVDKEEYLLAKEQLLVHQNKKSVAVLNKDYEYSKYFIPLVKGELKLVSAKGKVEDGAYVLNGEIFYAKNGKSKKIADTSEIALVGSHNIENILPALTIAMELGVKAEECHDVIKEFKNLPHRLQFVREVGGVKFYNDSYSTTPETSMAAVDSFEQPTVLIAGGYDKGADYNEWAVKILTKESLHTVILIGATSDKMEKALFDAEEKLGQGEDGPRTPRGTPPWLRLRPFPTKILRRNALEDAVIDAYAESDNGGVVVMSPAAASFDMFKNYKERGNEFVTQVRKLK